MSKNINACMSHIHDNWATPTPIYETIKECGYKDPCKLNAKYNGLKNHYKNEKIYINPPFSKLKEWVDYAIEESKNNLVLILMPSRTDTKYFHKILNEWPLIIFIKGRLHFNDSKEGAPFPTMLLVLDKRKGNERLPIYLSTNQEDLKQLIKRL